MYCGGDIKPGTFVRSVVIVDREDNAILGAKLCQDCCLTLAKYDECGEEPNDFIDRMDKFRRIQEAE